MAVGKLEGDPCDRLVGTWGNTRRCAGEIAIQGVGVDDAGRGYRFLGCPSCGWTTRDLLPEPETMPLFDGDAA